jgi:hypothetical protein
VKTVDLKLKHIHEEGRDFIVRVCMNVEDVDAVVLGSIVRQCDECGRSVWFDVNQIPPVVPGVTIEGEVALCVACTVLHTLYDGTPPNWVGPRPEDLL